MKKTVCVDLDGVLLTYDGWKGPDHFGEPRPGAAEFMAELRRSAHVVVFTTRTKADFDDRPPGSTPESLAAKVRSHLDGHGIGYDDVYVGQGKPMAACYLDDRAVGIASNPTAEDFSLALLAVWAMLKR